MKTNALAQPACLALLLSLGGCFGGEDAKDNPVGPSRGANVARISPGLYVGDYTPYAPADILGGELESEFLIGADGAYRFFWFLDNTPVVDVLGDWTQRDSLVYFDGVSEAYLDQDLGFFYPGVPVEGDTNVVRDVTANSFTRREWTPLRQKPLWVTYRKRDAEDLPGDGSFTYSEDFAVDSATALNYRMRVRLDGRGYSEDFVRSYGGDTLNAHLAEGRWSQIGSVFLIERYIRRGFDTASHAYRERRDTLPGAILQRIREVSDTAFQLWAPGAPGTWDVYRKE